METRGRKPSLGTDEQIIQALVQIQDKTFTSRYLIVKLIGLGFVETYKEKTQGRGRPKVKYQLSDEGRKKIGIMP